MEPQQKHSTLVEQAQQVFNRIPAPVYLWIAIIIFGASSAVTRRLTQIGEQNFVDGRNPVSLCNVLFAGNLCALLVLILIYWREWNLHSLKQLSKKDWISLFGVAILSGAVAPGLIFDALSRTQVNNVILLGRIEPPLVLVLSAWLLAERVNKWQVAGAIVSLVGVFVTVFLQGLWEDMMNPDVFISLGLGEVFAGAGGAALAISTIISKIRISKIPLGIYTVFRTAVGTIIFFLAAKYIYGNNHFMDILSPFLWRWMLLYGTVIVVVGQSFWLTGLKNSSASKVSLASSFTPIAGIIAAFLVLGEAPTLAQYVGGSVIILGIVLSQIGIGRKQSGSDSDTQESHSQEMDNRVGFKGI